MFHHPTIFTSIKARHITRTILASILVLGLIFYSPSLNSRSATAQTGPVVQHDFEDGTLQGWIPRGGGVVLTNSTEAAATGTNSLKTIGRSQGFHGPSLNILGLLARGATYQVTASVRLAAGEAATTLTATVQQTPAGGGGNQFVTVAQNANVTDAAWVTLTGLYSFGTEMSGVLFYIEAASPTASYYVDNFSITFLAPPPGPPPNTTGIATDFETNTTEGWASRIGVEVVTVTSADQHSGSNSLLTTNRAAAFQGPAIDVTNAMFNGSRYRISLWAKLAPGEPASALRVSLERRLGSVTSFHTVIGNTNVTADQWVNLRTMFDLSLVNQRLILYVESSSAMSSFYIDDFRIEFVPPPVAEPDIPSVYQSLAEYFRVGAAVYQGDLTGEHAVLLTKHFNSITSENDMKWGTLQPAEGNFNFTNADAQVSFGRANNMHVRGHTLVWHQQTPAWVFNDASGSPMTPSPENRALLLQRMETHIREVVSHYRDDIYAWDVVNEVIDPSQPDGFRRSQWFNIIGPEFIERAFQIAHEADPDALLYINDFDTTNVTKRQFLFDLINDLKSRGVPIHGIGHQMHNNIDFPSSQAIIDTINMFDGLGLRNELTELDVSIYSGSSTTIFDDYSIIPQDLFIRQGYRYRIFFDAFRQLQGKIDSITFWGQADDHTWLTTSGRVNGPLLFDQSLKKKFAYWGIIDPLQLPGADISTSIKASSWIVLSGRSVSYTITVKNNQDNDLEEFLPADDDLPAANVSMTSAIPTGMVFKSLAAPAGWSCTTPPVGSGGQVNCTIASLDPGASAQFKLALTATCSTASGTHILNSAAATSTTSDPNTALNNTASINIKVINLPPFISGLRVDKPVLRPPNHRMVDVKLSYNVHDDCDDGLVPVITISSNQPVNGHGDGNTAPDWEVIDAHHIRLRAERSAHSREARKYTIKLTVTDSAGSSASRSVFVIVPR
jgi:endo-1,4-beta-xylanase